MRPTTWPEFNGWTIKDAGMRHYENNEEPQRIVIYNPYLDTWDAYSGHKFLFRKKQNDLAATIERANGENRSIEDRLKSIAGINEDSSTSFELVKEAEVTDLARMKQLAGMNVTEGDDPRPVTTKLLELMDNGSIPAEFIVYEMTKYFSEDEIESMVHAMNLFDEFGADDEDEY